MAQFRRMSQQDMLHATLPNTANLTSGWAIGMLLRRAARLRSRACGWTACLMVAFCVEDYEGADGHKGVSLSIYDASRKVWHQTWVTNRGELLVIEGAFQGGKMVLIGADRTQDGTQRQVRGSWKPEGDGVRETAVTSTDGARLGSHGLISCSAPASDGRCCQNNNRQTTKA